MALQNNDITIELKDSSSVGIENATEIVYQLFNNTKTVVKLTKKLSTGGISVADVDGVQTATVTLTDDDTLDLQGLLYQEVKIQHPSGNVETLLQDTITFDKTYIREI